MYYGKTYPVRREFQNVTLKLITVTAEQKNCFEALGFNISE